MLSRLLRARKRALRSSRLQRPVPLSPGVAPGSEAHLRSLLAVLPRLEPLPEGRIVVAEAGDVGLAVEAGMAVPMAGVALRGWLADPHARIAGLWLEIDGEFREPTFSARFPRQDVSEKRGLADALPGYRAGYALVEASEVGPQTQVRANLHAIVPEKEGYVLLTSGLRLSPGAGCSRDRLFGEFHASGCSGSAAARLARPFLSGVAAATRQTVGQERRIVAGGQGQADIAVVIIVEENSAALGHVLAGYEVCSQAARMEIILALRNPAAEDEVVGHVSEWRGSAPFAAIKCLIPSMPIGFGLVANAALEFSNAKWVALSTDEILAPNGTWASVALDVLRTQPGILVPDIRTFDRRPRDFSGIFDLDWASFEHDHAGVRNFRAPVQVVECMTRGCGFFLTSRDLLMQSGGFDETFSSADLSMLEFLTRGSISGTMRPAGLPGEFIYLRLPKYTHSEPAERLWDLYAAADTLGRIKEPARRSEMLASVAAEDQENAQTEVFSYSPA